MSAASRLADRHLPHAPHSRWRGPVPWLGLLLLVAVTGAQAQVRPPNAGQILQEAQPQSSPIPPPSDLGLTIRRQGPAPAASNETFPVRSIEISGNTLLPTDMLHALVASGEGKSLSLNDLDALADRITQAYHAQGHPLDRAYVPAQTLHDGVVRIAVLEARFGNIVLHNDSAVSDRPLEATLAPLQPGQNISDGPLERSLLLLSDIPGAAVSSVLSPGAVPGTSDLAVDVSSAPRYTGVLETDDYGNRYTGRGRVGGTFDINGLLHQGDVLELNVLTSGHDMNYGRVGYHFLLNGQGTTLGASISGLDYHLSNGLSALGAHGTAQVASVYLSQPFIRSTAYNLYGQLQYDHTQLRDEIDTASIANNRNIDAWTATLAGDERDSHGITNASASVSYGQVNYENQIAQLTDLLGPNTQGSFTKYDASISRLQQLDPVNAVYVGLLGQWANRNLDTSQQFYLGGPNSVPGYDVGALAGAQGNLATAEYRHDFHVGDLPGVWQVSLFADSGRVQVYKTVFSSGANNYRVSSAGVGLHWTGPNAWLFSASVATPIGATPDVTGIESSKVRVWAQLQKGF